MAFFYLLLGFAFCVVSCLLCLLLTKVFYIGDSFAFACGHSLWLALKGVIPRVYAVHTVTQSGN